MTTEYHCPRCNGYLTLGRRKVSYVPGTIFVGGSVVLGFLEPGGNDWEFAPWFGVAVIAAAVLVWGESLYRRRNNYWCEHCGTYYSRVRIESLIRRMPTNHRINRDPRQRRFAPLTRARYAGRWA